MQFEIEEYLSSLGKSCQLLAATNMLLRKCLDVSHAVSSSSSSSMDIEEEEDDDDEEEEGSGGGGGADADILLKEKEGSADGRIQDDGMLLSVFAKRTGDI